MPQEHKIILEILDEEDEGLEEIIALVEIALVNEFPDHIKWQLTEYEED